MKYILTYLLIVNAIAFLLMHLDKEKAKKKQWRIKEATLMSVAAIGGSIGALMGMYIFRHKTRHKRIAYGIPILLLLHIAAVAVIVHLMYFQ